MGCGTMSSGNLAEVRLQNFLLGAAAAICFAEAALGPRGGDPGPWAVVVLGLLLLRRAIITVPQPVIVILSGLLLTGIALAGDHGLLNVNNPGWIAITLIGFACYGFWERIQRLWK